MVMNEQNYGRMKFDRTLGDSEKCVAWYKSDERGNMTGDIIHQVKRLFLTFIYPHKMCIKLNFFHKNYW